MSSPEPELSPERSLQLLRWMQTESVKAGDTDIAQRLTEPIDEQLDAINQGANRA